MGKFKALTVVFLLVVSRPLPATAAPEQEMSTTSSCGGWCSNTTMQTATCAGQPGTTGLSTNGRYTHYTGFLGGAFILPGTTNTAGVALEADPDNDDDGLTDSDEVSGAAFQGYTSTDPNNGDSDNDGMSDADEAAGMYDPNDPGHLLKIIALTNNAGVVTLTWIGRGGGSYNTILWSDDLLDGPCGNTLVVIMDSDGDPPWYKTTNSLTWVETATNRYFRVVTE